MSQSRWPAEIAKFTSVAVMRGDVEVAIEFIGEGNSGDFDESDPDDAPLLRFTVSRRVDGQMEQVDDASYCTSIKIDAPIAKLEKLAERIMDEVYEGASGGHSIKRLCERLSWIDVDGNVPESAALSLSGTPMAP